MQSSRHLLLQMHLHLLHSAAPNGPLVCAVLCGHILVVAKDTTRQCRQTPAQPCETLEATHSVRIICSRPPVSPIRPSATSCWCRSSWFTVSPTQSGKRQVSNAVEHMPEVARARESDSTRSCVVESSQDRHRRHR